MICDIPNCSRHIWLCPCIGSVGSFGEEDPFIVKNSFTEEEDHVIGIISYGEERSFGEDDSFLSNRFLIEEEDPFIGNRSFGENIYFSIPQSLLQSITLLKTTRGRHPDLGR